MSIDIGTPSKDEAREFLAIPEVWERAQGGPVTRDYDIPDDVELVAGSAEGRMVALAIFIPCGEFSQLHFYVLRDFRMAHAIEFLRAAMTGRENVTALVPNSAREVVNFAKKRGGFREIGITQDEKVILWAQ